MFLSELLKASYLKEEAPSDEEITILPKGAKPGIDCNLVVTRQSFEQVLVTYRSTEPASESILMAIGTAYEADDPVWEALLQVEAVVNHYTNLSSIYYANKLAELEKAEEEPDVSDAKVTGIPEESVEGNTEEEEAPVAEEQVEESQVEEESQPEEESTDGEEESQPDDDVPTPDENSQPEEEESQPDEEPQQDVEPLQDEEPQPEEDEEPQRDEESPEDVPAVEPAEEEVSEEPVDDSTSIGDAFALDDSAFQPAEDAAEFEGNEEEDAGMSVPSMADILAGASIPVVEDEEEEEPEQEESEESAEAEGEEEPTQDTNTEVEEGRMMGDDSELLTMARENVEHVLNDFVEIFTTYGADNVCAQTGTSFKEFLSSLAGNSDAVDSKVLAGRDAEEITPTDEVVQDIAKYLREECLEVLSVGDIDWCNTLLKPILRIIYEE